MRFRVATLLGLSETVAAVGALSGKLLAAEVVSPAKPTSETLVAQALQDTEGRTAEGHLLPVRASAAQRRGQQLVHREGQAG